LRISVGFKAHSGWAVQVAISLSGNDLQVIDRRRIELVEPGATWAKQPYHAAEGLPSAKAKQLVKRGVESAYRVAAREMEALVERSKQDGHEIIGCAILIGTPMPEWTTEQILAVHMRMHKAEGLLFPGALASAAAACELNVLEISEKSLTARGAASPRLAVVTRKISQLGKTIGPPWGKDQKAATLAAAIGFEQDLG
jgi:hypothetical protein